MAITERYFNPDVSGGAGANNGTSEADGWWTWADMVAGAVAGDRVNMKKTAIPYQPGAGIAWALDATDLLVSILRGYGSTITDGIKFQFDMQTANTLTISGRSCLIQNIDVTGSDTISVVTQTGDLSRIENFWIVNTGTSTSAHTALTCTDGVIINGYLETNSTSSTSFALECNRPTIEDIEIVTTRGGASIVVGFKAVDVDRLLVYEKGAAATTGIEVTGHSSSGACAITNYTVDGFTTSVSITSLDDVATATEPVTLSKGIMSNATTGIANTDTATKNMTVVAFDLAFYNCTTDTQLGDNEVIRKISLTADPYTDAAGDDYSLNNTASGGADCRAASAFSGGKTTNYADIGALQHQDSGGGGGGMLVNPKMSGGMS